MRFGRNRNPLDRGVGIERLVGRTRNRLAVFTLVLVIALVSTAGLITAAAAVQAMDSSVDRTLRESAAAVMAGLVPEAQPPGASAVPGTSPEPESSSEDGSETNEDAGEGTRATPTPQVRPDPTGTQHSLRTTTPRPNDSRDSGAENGRANGEPSEGPGGERLIAVPALALLGSPAPSPSPSPSRTPAASAAGGLETDEHIPSSADTFFLQLDRQGSLVANPQNVSLAGLPDLAAVAAARATGEDLRTTTVDGVPVRLLTQPIVGADHVMRGFLQSAIVLTLLRSQEADLWQTVFVVTLIGVLGAAVVTLLVTNRALTPVRRAFATERRFVAAASHELRTPVAVIRASAEILGRENLVSLEGQRFVNDVISESDRLARLIGDLLALSSIQAGAISLRPMRLDLRAFLVDVAGRAASMASARGVSIVADTGPSASPLVDVDPERLEQLLMILVDNAVDHSPQHGVVRLVLHGGLQVRDRASLSVVDQGPGVPPRERKRVFEPFARLPGRRRGGGTGLGLAIAGALAERLGAVIAVGDTPGGGATFSVILRASVRQIPSPEAESARVV